MSPQKRNNKTLNFRLPSRLMSQSGQGMVEFLVILPVMLLLIFGSIQFALIYHAKITLNYAAFEAGRAGTLGYGKFDEVKEGFARGLAPLYSYFESDIDIRKKREGRTAEDQVEAFQMARNKIYEEFDSDNKLIRIERLNPTDNAFNTFTKIHNDNLKYRSSTPQGKSHVSLQDANLLHLRITYWYPLYVPLVNNLIFNKFICHKKSNDSEKNSSGKWWDYGSNDSKKDTSGKWDDDPVCMDKNQEPVIPLTATIVMRMQTPLVNSDGYFVANQLH